MTDQKPPVTDTVWKQHETLYSSIGQAISMWASTEGEIVEIATILIGTTERKAGLIFYSIMNFYAWLSIIDELFSLDPLYEPHKPDWGECSEVLRMLNDTRVRLAHHTVWDRSSEAPLGIAPGKYDVRAKSRKHKALSEAEVLLFTKGVLDISDKLTELANAMKASKASPPTSLGTLFERPADPHTQEDVPLGLLSAILKAPPQSSSE
jgi:hypothetical protein